MRGTTKAENPNKTLIAIFIKIYIVTSLVSLSAFVLDAEYQIFPIIAGVFGGGIFLASIILFFSGRKLIPLMDSIIKGQNLVDSWTLTAEQIDAYAESERKRFGSNVQITVVVAFLAGALLGALGIKGMNLLQGLVLGVVIASFAWLIGTLYLRSMYLRNKNGNGEIFISLDGVIINGAFFTWEPVGSYLQAVRYNAAEMLLEFDYASVSRRGSSQKNAFIPVPPEKVADIPALLKSFHTHYNMEPAKK